MPASAKLLSIATANAPNVMTQTDVVRVAQALFRDRFPGIDRMLPVFDTAGIRTRQSAMPLDWYVLDRARRRGLPNRSVVTALGPGFTLSTVTLRAAA